ncbi:MAG: HemK family protein methyltransferase, partial [Gammaproteobacteria bacterium]|nr:HemK family protein methyltransferase [Gammaproteobacteria bacterium]
IAGERPLCKVTAVDVSEDALAVARENVRALSQGNVTLAHGNWTEPVQGHQFDIIVANPPYVRSDDEALRDLQHEPQSALAAGDDGLDAIRALAADCPTILLNNGMLLIEHGADQAPDVAALLENHGWAEICCHNDLAGLPRVTAARSGGK